MKQIWKKAAAVLAVLLLLAAIRMIVAANRPLVIAPIGTAPLDNKIDVSDVAHLMVDNAGVLSEEAKQIILIYNANWSALENRVMAVVTVETTEHAEDDAQQWAQQLSLGENDALLLIEASGNKDCALVSGGTFREDIATLDEVFLKRLTYISLHADEFDAAALAVCEELHYFFDYDVESYQRSEEKAGLIVLGVLSAIVLPILIHMLAEKIDSFRFKRWHRNHGMDDPPIVPWKTIFFWHRAGSKWYEMRISGEWIDYRKVLREARREAGVRSMMRGGRMR